MENAEETHKAETEKQRKIRARTLNDNADETHRIEAEKQRRLRSINQVMTVMTVLKMNHQTENNKVNKKEYDSQQSQ